MEVCQLSGQPKTTCDWGCEHCTHTYLATPGWAYIYAAAALIRLTWPADRLAKQEGNRLGELEIPQAHKVSDHMRRKPAKED